MEQNNKDGTVVPSSHDKHGTFPERLKSIIISCKSKSNLARITGLSESVIRKWEKGLSEPDLSNLIALAEAGNRSVEWLATGKQQPPPSHQKSNVKNLKLDIFNDAVDYRSSGNSSLSPEEVQEQRITEVRNDFRKKMHDYKDATIEIGYTPPTLITEAIKTIMYSQGLTKSGAVILLNALKQQQNLNKEGR